MDKFTSHSGTAMPMRRNNVDTDQIIPSGYLKRVTRTGFEDGLFADWRTDPEFVLNDPRYSAASILIAGDNFGIGSSREHAVWALMDYGFKVVVAAGFADIFRGNAGNAGLVAIRIDLAVIEQLWAIVENDPRVAVTVDLEARALSVGDLTADFQIDDNTRRRLLEGLDNIEVTLSHEDKIAAFESSRPSWRPVIV